MRNAAPLLLALLAAACGDPLVGETFVGTPELTIGGVVMQANQRVPSDHGPLRLSVFWIGAPTPGGSPIEQDARLGSGLAEYSMTLFDPPPAEAGAFSELLAGQALALGVIALYADKNEDRALDLDTDLLLGASEQHLVVYAGARAAAGSPATELLGELAPGYHVYTHDVPSTCHFVQAATCAPEGRLTPAPELDKIALKLWETPAEVVVPAPALTRNGTTISVWALEAR